jgi:hypothetical protein
MGRCERKRRVMGNSRVLAEMMKTSAKIMEG